MKKRAIEAAAILAVMIILFAAVNFMADSFGNSSVKIDGEYYNTGKTDLTLTLMTEDGTDELTRFTRLRSLKIIPYKAAVINSLKTGNPETDAAIITETENTYSECTDVTDISFLSGLLSLERLDVSYCSTEDISCISELENITALNIAYTKVSDLSVLAGMDNISELIVTGIPAEDYSPLLEMDGLSLVKMTEGADDDTVEKLTEKGVNVELYE